MNDHDVGARMAEIVGAPQRIAPVEEAALGPEALAAAKAVRLAFGIPESGGIPDVLRTMLVHPGLFRTQVDMGVELAGRGTIPQREREIAILRNAWLLGAPYEWGEHVDIAKTCGVTDAEIARARGGSAAPGWSRHETAILRAVEQLREHAMIDDATWSVLAETWDDRQLMEFPVLIGQYTSTAYLQNAVRVRLAPTNQGLRHA